MMNSDRGRQGPGTGGMRILFIPDMEIVRTSERSPMILRLLRERHEVVGLRCPRDPLLYNPARATWPRALLYVVDKALLVLRGLAIARRQRTEVVFCETVHHALAGLLIAKVLGVRCVWDSHGTGTLMSESMGRSPWSIRLIGAFETFIANRVDDLITVCDRDASAYGEMGVPRSKIHMIPTSVRLREIDSSSDPTTEVPSSGEGGLPVLLFFGSFGYAPNLEALRFVNDVLAPHLELEGIRCEIRIAGRDIPRMSFHPSVRAVGFVPDIHACIRAASVCIVPVRRGVGMLTKVIDAMAVGTPVVLSEFAVQGIPEIRHGVHAYVATTDAEFLRHVAQALVDPASSRAMARQARQLVERKYDWDVHAEALDAIVRAFPVSTPGGEYVESRNHHVER